MQPRYSLRIPELVAGFIRKLHPRLKRKLRAALETIAAEPHVALGGSHRLRGRSDLLERL